ncbi:hypothetical protein KBP30_02250 [Streptomyces sp. Go40/10]|uniref:hypothetical protein n=1 Tax=Streptomyces sp. Go40/10 TaxID=2825844 RepID=UPI001E456163|nr:hypothetical protein [Streptomyces sp. Go40/10]UFR00078.1 hypothetical protein KBP30_02250 [Streptomyces sp. Go40/10]
MTASPITGAPITGTSITGMPKPRLEATHHGRTFTIEAVTVAPEEGPQRGEVASLRREYGFPLPAPDWESDDETGLVLLCRTDDVPVGTVRLVRRQRETDGWCPYLTAELRAALPADPDGFVFGERLVVSPEARSLEVLAVIMHAAATWTSTAWGVAEFAAITRPALVRLAGWLGARQLSEPMVLPGSDGLGLLIGGRLEEAAVRTKAMFSTGGWHLTSVGELPTTLARLPEGPPIS